MTSAQAEGDESGGFLLLLLAIYFYSTPWVAMAVLGVFLACLGFGVRGYSIDQGEVRVHRLGWATRIDLSSLHKVYMSPGSTIGSVRLMGNGRLF